MIAIYALGDIFQLTTGFQALYNHGISLGTFPDGFLRKPMGKLAWKFTTHWDKALPMQFPSSSTLVPCWPLTPFLSCMVLLDTLHPLWLPHSLYHLTAATYLPVSLVTFCWLSWFKEAGRKLSHLNTVALIQWQQLSLQGFALLTSEIVLYNYII